MAKYTVCPKCHSIWGLEEIEWQQCDCCGYPNLEDDDNIEELLGDDDFDEEEHFHDNDNEF